MANVDTSKPNVVFILTDDQGEWALGCAGNDEIKTPNLDRLAETGVRFENFFCTSPVCSPARASILTGKMPSQHGVHDFVFGDDKEDDEEYLKGHTTYPELLAKHGYDCGLSGKWHVGSLYEPYKGFSHWNVCKYNDGKYMDPIMVRDGKDVQETGYLTDIITDDALQFLENRGTADHPFYLSVHYTAPHHLWVGEHPQEYVDLYEDCAFDSCPQEPEHPWFLEIANPESVRTDPRANLQGYFAAVTAMDHSVGRILDKLEELGVRDNTLIVFMSDNGMNCGHHGIWGKGNGTFPQNMFDTSIRVPAIINHPGRIQEGIVSDELLSQYDFMPTLLDYVGIENPEQDELPGKSFLPLLQGKKGNIQDEVVVYDEYGPVRMIRTKKYKYVHRYPYGPYELYDLKNDPDERKNLYRNPDHQDVVNDLRARLTNWFVKYADPALDGARQPVTGTGQLGLVGPEGKGKQVFRQEALKHNQTRTEED